MTESKKWQNEERNIAIHIEYKGRNWKNKLCIVIVAQCRGYSVFLISSRNVITQNCHDGRPRNGTYYCSAKSTGPFEGSRRFKVELLSFDIREAARARTRAYAILRGTANEIPSGYPFACETWRSFRGNISFRTLCFFPPSSFFSSKTVPEKWCWLREFSETYVMEVRVYSRAHATYTTCLCTPISRCWSTTNNKVCVYLDVFLCLRIVDSGKADGYQTQLDRTTSTGLPCNLQTLLTLSRMITNSLFGILCVIRFSLTRCAALFPPRKFIYLHFSLAPA